MEKVLNFTEYDVNGDAAYTLRRAIAAAKEAGATRLTVPKGVYDIRPDYCSERYLCISNHGFNGPKRIAALIEDMSDFEIDFGGSTLVCHGVITPIAVLRSRNIRIRNLTLRNSSTMMLEARVTGHGSDDTVELQPVNGREAFVLKQGRLYAQYLEGTLVPVSTNVEFTGEGGEIAAGTADNTFDVGAEAVTYEDLPDGRMLAHGVRRKPPIGNILVISAARRLGAGMFCEESTGITAENITVNACYGMGFIAQMCGDIHLDRFSTLREEGRMHTSDADATHFVNCSGRITVENCTFEGQLDDALNIHGMYTRIVGKGEKELFVRQMHEEATGIRIYRPGDRVQALEPAPLIPYATLTVRTVEYLNNEIIRLTFEESVEEIAVGDDIENITQEADLLFRNNIVRNNRARGMLIANRGRTVIEDCYFHTSGTAVKFESDGDYWFESGGTGDVTIRRCTFDRCKHGGWGRGVIECQPRRAVLPDRYFHHYIRVEDNEFRMYQECAALMDNVETFVFTGNRILSAPGKRTEVIVRNNRNCTLQPDVVRAD